MGMVNEDIKFWSVPRGCTDSEQMDKKSQGWGKLAKPVSP